MFTVLVAPVIGAIVTAPDDDVLAGVVLGLVTVAADVSTATCVVSAGFFSPPAHAPSEITPIATAHP